MTYRVAVTAGAHSWNVTSGDSADYGLADPVTISRSLPDVDLFPAQPNPAQATFSVVVPDAADLADVLESTEVAIHVYAPSGAATPLESFHGRVSDVKAAPHPLGTVYSYTCVDYLADLIEEEVVWEEGATTFDTVLVQDLVDDLFAQVGLTVGFSGTPPPQPIGLPFGDTYFRPPAPGAGDVEGTFLAMLERFLSQWITADEPRRVVITLTNGDATITGDPGTFLPADVGRPIFGNVSGHIPPGTTIASVTSDTSAEMSAAALSNYATFLANIGVSEWDNAYRLVLEQNITADALDPVTPYVLRPALRAASVDPTTPPDPGEVLVVDGDYVESGSSYSLNKRQAVRRIRVKYEGGSWVASYGTGPLVTVKILSDLYDSGNAALVADFYLPDDVPRGRWVADTFTWRLDRDPSGTYLPALGDPVSISPVAAAWNPLGYTWFTGRLVDYTLTIAKGRHEVDFTLRDTAS